MTNNFEWSESDDRAIKMSKALAADAVQNAGNGHPGTAVSLAPAAYLLFQKHIRFNPANMNWAGRDRFILSIGHSSLTLYLQMYLSGVMTMDDLKTFRKFGSRTPGHPEFPDTPGAEMTTGPLGQGLSTAVGFACGQRYEKGLFDPESFETGKASPFDHRVYVIAGDGDLQEGITSEASAFAGNQKLGNLIVLWDDNHISIEDDTDITMSEDVLKRYEAYGWHVQRVDWLKKNHSGKDDYDDETSDYVEDIEALNTAVENAKAETSKPSIIALRTLIAYPTPTKTNSGSSHGSPLGEEAIKGLKETLGIDPEAKFYVDEEALEHARKVGERGAKYESDWNELFDAWKSKNSDKFALYDRLAKKELPAGFDELKPDFEIPEKLATRAASGKVINQFAKILPELWGGSADLAGSNNTTITDAKSFGVSEHSTKNWSNSPYGRVIHFGIREHAMGAILNGIELGSLTHAFGGTFFMFCDYMRPAVRLAALMGVPAKYVWTHDSIGVGEDGATHQPVESLSAMRTIPNLNVVRPADAYETFYAWKEILKTTDSPSGIVLTRQAVPTLDTKDKAQNVCKGAYVLSEKNVGGDKVLLLATGSEVQLAVEAQDKLAAKGISSTVVSMPCFEWFEKQSDEYKESVLSKDVKARVSVEAGIKMSWYKYIGDNGEHVGIEHYGTCGDGGELFKKFGITSDSVVEAALRSLENTKKN